MPIHIDEDAYGTFVQWGSHGSRYYFNPNSERSYSIAHKKAIRQMVAAMYHGYRSEK